MWQYSDNEHIKLYRKIINWEWYTDVSTKTLFLHCLLRANWKDEKWRGIEIKRGQFITSLATLSKESGLSVQQVRTSLKRLQLTNELTSKQQGKYRLITVVSYDSYQVSNKINNKMLTRCQQDANNRYKNNNKNNNKGEENTHPETDDELIEFLKNREKNNDRRTDDTN